MQIVEPFEFLFRYDSFNKHSIQRDRFTCVHMLFRDKVDVETKMESYIMFTELGSPALFPCQY